MRGMGPACHFCGAPVENPRDVYRTTTCPSCRRDLRICLNCRFYSPGAQYDCAETVDEQVTDKERANFCTFFAFRSYGGTRRREGRRHGARMPGGSWTSSSGMTDGQALSGRVLRGINTIYDVATEAGTLRCRIKGKVLKTGGRTLQPHRAGRRGVRRPDPATPGTGKITSLAARRTTLARWNRKGRASQVLAANADLAVCVTSTRSPPFRPRFIDRLAAAAEDGGLEVLILLNKCDLGVREEDLDRLDDFRRIGYRVHRCSAATGDGHPRARPGAARDGPRCSSVSRGWASPRC